jgi:hypothetical protein
MLAPVLMPLETTGHDVAVALLPSLLVVLVTGF